jgi:hypothetical protein
MELEVPPSDGACPWELCCANANSWKCRLRQKLQGAESEHYPCFKDKEYYRKTLPFIEVKWLFGCQEDREHG